MRLRSVLYHTRLCLGFCLLQPLAPASHDRPILNMLLLESLLRSRIPSVRAAIQPLVKTVYELVASVIFTLLFIVSIFRLLNHFRVALSEIFRTLFDVYRSVREIYEVFSNLLQPLVLVWRLLVTISIKSQNLSQNKFR
ncbi:hypothetical protein GE061_007045 [Apolygus lucorum]|uniref:Gustatory receptor n=1 Tax=Apolygus lucorum TaxID=248454 RepID=A0A8S9WQK8_APOLU|nr:hypothetical protein GE061_007045 [Apolygus lucorum]